MADDDSKFDQLARDMFEIRKMLTSVVNSISEAEAEVPEKMRRFVMYAHDVHDIAHMYEERGLPVPRHVSHEMERCDDRFRHLLEDLHDGTGAFERVRKDMAERKGNRWDHTRLLPRSGE